MQRFIYRIIKFYQLICYRGEYRLCTHAAHEFTCWFSFFSSLSTIFLQIFVQLQQLRVTAMNEYTETNMKSAQSKLRTLIYIGFHANLHQIYIKHTHGV